MTARRRLALTAGPLACLAVLAGTSGCSSETGPLVEQTVAASAASAQVEPAPRAIEVQEVVEAIRARLVAASGDSARRRAELTEVGRLYEQGDHAPLWVDAWGRPNARAAAALALLARAADDGLDPAAYDEVTLNRLVNALRETPTAAGGDVGRFDVSMSLSLLRYIRHVHLGRIDAQTIGFSLVVPPEPHDFVEVLRSALEQDRVAHLREDLAPQLVQYDLLRRALTRYRTIASAPPLMFPADTGPAVRPGDTYAHTADLRAFLVALGDLDAAAASAADQGVYEEPLVGAVQRFQARHGLEADGVIGRGTRDALRVPLAWRVRQIELALERLRWLPDLDDRRLIVVNIPMFHLWGWDTTSPGTLPAIDMRAIVGRAMSTQTPVFVADMRHVVFRPYWNVPRSILRNELLPRLDRDVGYLDRENLEIVHGQSDAARPVPPTPEAVARLRDGTFRLRQRPGPRNALGLVKFLFPNANHVYMHDTPTQSLFSRTRRDFSHGCIRIEDPVAMALWALQEQPAWTRERIEAAMAASSPTTVDLTRPVRVMIFYTTAAIAPRDGALHFAADIYRHDARLDAALAESGTRP